MSCPNATSPIDITMSNIKGKCDLKCSYGFQYGNSSCIATNRANYISMSYDKVSSNPVLYNSTGYYVQEVRLYTPSLHSYNGSKTDGELIILHASNTGSKPLLVCIPIKSNNTSSQIALFFKTLIDTVSSSAPADGESTTINATQYNLDNFVPKKPFFSYSATEPYQPCSSSVDFIVFSPLQTSLDIMPETLTVLQSVISKNKYEVTTGPNLFYNERGPSSQGANNGDIYIDCQPVGSTDDTTEIITSVSGSPYPTSMRDLLKNVYIQLLLGSLLFIILLYFVKYLLSIVKPVKIINSIRRI